MPIFVTNHLKHFQSSLLYLVQFIKEKQKHETKNSVIYAYHFIKARRQR